MLSTGGKIAAHPTEDACPLERSKAPRDLLLYLGHPNIVLALIIRKGHELVGHEPERFRFKIAQTFEEVA